MGVTYQLRTLITVRYELISIAARPSLLFLTQGAWWDGRSRPDYMSTDTMLYPISLYVRMYKTTTVRIYVYAYMGILGGITQIIRTLLHTK